MEGRGWGVGETQPTCVYETDECRQAGSQRLNLQENLGDLGKASRTPALVKKPKGSSPLKKSPPFLGTLRKVTPTWMDLGGITLNERSQTEKDKFRTISLICGI